MKFNYQARTKTGEIQTGVVEASSRETAFDALKSHGLYVTAMQEEATPLYAKKVKILERITRKDIVLFSRQVAIMIKSQVPIVEILETLARQTKKAGFREKIMKMAETIEGGSPLSQSLALFPKLFSVFFISMVKSGEASGKLTDVFDYLADYLEREYTFRAKLRGAMVYPAFILFVFIVVVGLIVTLVIPQLSTLLEETGQDLPWITKFVLAASDFISQQGWILLLLVIGIIIALYGIKKTDQGKRFFDTNFLRVPLLAPFLKKIYLTRFALNLSTLISGGLPIAKALEITGEVVGNVVYKDIINLTKEEVRKGEQISAVLQGYPSEVTPFFHQMVVVGEKTGTLDSSLTNVVTFYQRDIDRTLDNLTKLIEPIFIIALGGVVGGLMAAVMIPLYSFETV